MQNITITSLFAVSFLHSPFLSNNFNYIISSCRFTKFCPIIFYQIQHLNLEKSSFSHTLSNIINVSNRFTKENCESFEPVDGKITINGCQFFRSSSIVLAKNTNISVSSCLFSDISSYDYEGSLLEGHFLQTSTKQQIYQFNIKQNCFSNCKSFDSFITVDKTQDYRKIDVTFVFDLNMVYQCQDKDTAWSVTEDSQKGLITPKGLSVSSTSCNFTSNVTPYPIIAHQPNFADTKFVSIEFSQFNNNTAGAILFSFSKKTLISTNVSLFAVYMYRNTITLFTGPVGPIQTNLAIFYLAAPIIIVKNCDFDEFAITSSLQINALKVFAPIDLSAIDSNFNTETLSPIFLFENNVFGRKPRDQSFNEAAISYYTSLRSTITNNSFTNTPLVMQSIPYDENIHTNWNQYCPMHHTATAIFTDSQCFTASSAFNPTAPFTSSYTLSFVPPTRTPPPTPTISVNVAYAACGAIGTAVVSFGVAALLYLAIRKSCVYDPTNYLHIDV